MIRSLLVFPSRIEMTRFTFDASSLSCVTITIVIPSCSFNLRNISRISSAVFRSTAPVGSSASRSFGSLARAIAMATRCCSPPESWLNVLSFRSARPTSSRSSSARFFFCASLFPSFIKSIGVMTFSHAVRYGSRFRALFCHTKPTVLRLYSTNSSSLIWNRFFPST